MKNQSSSCAFLVCTNASTTKPPRAPAWWRVYIGEARHGFVQGIGNRGSVTAADLHGGWTMRLAFQEQPRLDCPPVAAVPLNLNCRDEIIPILRALQHVYEQTPVRNEVLA